MTQPSRAVTRCVVCGVRFKAARADARYCSGACRQRAHRARMALDDLDREIERARLYYWALIDLKATAAGTTKSRVLTDEAQFVTEDGGRVPPRPAGRGAGSTWPPGMGCLGARGRRPPMVPATVWATWGLHGLRTH